jgi:intraflagellar transport protein 81
LINQFKDIHKTYDNLISTQHTTADLKNDIEKMEEEKEQIIKRLERVKKRVDSVNNSNAMLELSRNYRMEVEREEKIGQQKVDLKNELSQLDHKIDRLEKVLKEQQSSYHDLKAESKFNF